MLKISYGLFDVTAFDDSQPSAADIQPFTDVEQIKEDIVVDYLDGTLELNHFLLDGNYSAFSDEPQTKDWGLWSLSMSDANGWFDSPVELVIDFNENHSSLGLTFQFGVDWASDMDVEWYDSSNTLLLDKNFKPDGELYFAEGQVEDYRKLIIKFNRTVRPYSYLKFERLLYGSLMIFGGKNLLSADLLEEVDPIGATLPINELTFKIYSKDFAILDPQGLFAVLQKRQEIEVTSDKGYMGLYYMNEPTADTNDMVEFQCIDALGVLDMTNFVGGIYIDKDAGELICEITEGFECDITGFEGVNVSGWLPIMTRRNALQQVAFAIGAIIDCSRSKAIKVYPMPDTITDTISYETKLAGHRLAMLPLVTGVEVSEKTYSQSNEDIIVADEILDSGIYTFTFSEPTHSIMAVNATIIESHFNYVIIEVEGVKSVIVQGKKYDVGIKTHKKIMPELPSNELTNTVQVEELYLTSDASQLAERIFNYYQLRYEGEGGIVLVDERAGVRTIMSSMNNYQVDGYIERLEIDLVRGYKSNMIIRGRRAE